VLPLSQTRAYLKLLVCVALWASYPATAKLALTHFPPFILGTVRCFLGLLFLVLFLRRQVGEAARALNWRDLPGLTLLTLTGVFLSNSLVYLAIYLTTASNTILLQTAMPVMVVLAARLFLGERLSRLQWTGVICSAAGVLLVVSKGEWGALRPAGLQTGDLLVLTAMCLWTANTIYGKRLLAVYSPAVATVAAYALSAILLPPLTLATVPLFPAPRFLSPVAWVVIFYHALTGAFAHFWWYEAVRAVGASRSAIFVNFQPFLGVALAVTLLGETIGLAQLLGGLAVLVGVTLTTRQK
jgi:drug/metabolite transporter (DMT)-like permease